MRPAPAQTVRRDRTAATTKLFSTLLVIIALGSPAVAQNRIGTLRPNPFIPGQTDVYDNSGHRVGELRESPFIPGQTDVYDNSGHRDATIRDNPFLPGQRDIETDLGGDD